MDAARFQNLADQQDGLFTRAQARSCGFSAYQIRRRLTDGTWKVVLGPVLAPAGVRITPRLRDVAAQLALPGAVLAGPSAARWYGVEVSDHDSYLHVADGHHIRIPGVRAVRQPLAQYDVMLADGVLVTTRERAIFDCLR